MFDVLNRRQLLAIAAGSLLVPARSAAGAEVVTISDRERKEVLDYLEETRAMLAGEAAMSEAQWLFKPSPEIWSTAEVVEHVTVVEESVFSSLSVMMAEPPLPPDQRPGLKDQTIVLVATNREQRRLKAPEKFKPSSRWPGRAGQIDAFLAVRRNTTEYARSTRDDLRAHVRDNPLLGPIDALQWLLFIGAHSERHAKQIRELKANPLFPVK